MTDADAEPKGTCYQDALERFLDEQANSVGGARLVHGSVLGEGGVRVKHAWIEGRADVWDPQLSGVCSREAYYKRFQPEPRVTYTRYEARRAWFQAGHYGAWDED